jgi:hypothetical protein
MIKTSLAFLAGVIAMALVVYVTGARFAAPMFFAGIVTVLAPSIALLASVERIRTAARFLNAFADSWQGKKPEPVIETDPLAGDVASALVNQGVGEKLANKIAAQAVKGNRDFDPAYRAALLLVPKSTRRAS